LRGSVIGAISTRLGAGFRGVIGFGRVEKPTNPWI